MIYKGYKIKVRCIDWEQVDLLGRYWKLFTSCIESDNYELEYIDGKGNLEIKIHYICA